jgi:hypothetical protein
MNATLQFPLDKLTEEQIEHIYRASLHLLEAGVKFDTGVGLGTIDWSLDWSLRGAELVPVETTVR